MAKLNYEKTIWRNNMTPVSETNMNHIEEGILDVTEQGNEHEEKLASLKVVDLTDVQTENVTEGDLLVSNGQKWFNTKTVRDLTFEHVENPQGPKASITGDAGMILHDIDGNNGVYLGSEGSLEGLFEWSGDQQIATYDHESDTYFYGGNAIEVGGAFIKFRKYLLVCDHTGDARGALAYDFVGGEMGLITIDDKVVAASRPRNDNDELEFIYGNGILTINFDTHTSVFHNFGFDDDSRMYSIDQPENFLYLGDDHVELGSPSGIYLHSSGTNLSLAPDFIALDYSTGGSSSSLIVQAGKVVSNVPIEAPSINLPRIEKAIYTLETRENLFEYSVDALSFKFPASASGYKDLTIDFDTDFVDFPTGRTTFILDLDEAWQSNVSFEDLTIRLQSFGQGATNLQSVQIVIPKAANQRLTMIHDGNVYIMSNLLGEVTSYIGFAYNQPFDVMIKYDKDGQFDYLICSTQNYEI